METLLDGAVEDKNVADRFLRKIEKNSDRLIASELQKIPVSRPILALADYSI